MYYIIQYTLQYAVMDFCRIVNLNDTLKPCVIQTRQNNLYKTDHQF